MGYNDAYVFGALIQLKRKFYEIIKLLEWKFLGTNEGRIYLTLEQDNKDLKGNFQINDLQFGTAAYAFSGQIDKKIDLKCHPISGGAGVILGNLTIEAVILENGNMKGEWRSSINTAGLFELEPQDNPLKK